MDKHVRKLLEYRGYVGDFGLGDDAILVGHVLGMKRSIITFRGETAALLEESFRTAVDAYLSECSGKQCKAEHPFKGSFNIRIGEARHSKLAKEARSKNTSINQLIIRAIDHFYSM